MHTVLLAGIKTGKTNTINICMRRLQLTHSERKTFNMLTDGIAGGPIVCKTGLHTNDETGKKK